MLRLFQDSDLLHPIEDRVLFEGVTYYLNVEGLPKSEITTWISENNLSSCLINFHPRNSVLNLRFDNIVGSVPILGDYFDVRSKKLYDNHSGNKQFQSLLDDIIKMQHRLSLNFKGVSLASRD